MNAATGTSTQRRQAVRESSRQRLNDHEQEGQRDRGPHHQVQHVPGGRASGRGRGRARGDGVTVVVVWHVGDASPPSTAGYL